MNLATEAFTFVASLTPSAGLCAVAIHEFLLEGAEDSWAGVAKLGVASLIVFAVTAPMVRWITGRLDRSLAMQEKMLKNQTAMLASISSTMATQSSALELLIGQVREQIKHTDEKREQMTRAINRLSERLEGPPDPPNEKER